MTTPTSSSSTSSPNELLKMIAVGKLARMQSDPSQFDPEHHELIYFKSITSSTLDKSTVKSYKQHMKAILQKGAQKLSVGKRILLTSDDNLYDVHVLPDALDDNEQRIIVFFAVSAPEFGKNASIAALFREFQSMFYEHHQQSQIWSAGNGTLNSQFDLYGTKLLSQYNQNLLANVSIKVEQVKETMKESVQRAITNVEQLEDMEEKSEEFEMQAKRFQKRSAAVKRMFCGRYVTITVMVGIVVTAVVAYIIYLIAK